MKTVLVLVAAAGFGAAGYYAQQPVGADTTPAPKAPGVGQDAKLHLEPRGAAQPAQPVGAPPGGLPASLTCTVVVNGTPAGSFPFAWDGAGWSGTVSVGSSGARPVFFNVHNGSVAPQFTPGAFTVSSLSEPTHRPAAASYGVGSLAPFRMSNDVTADWKVFVGGGTVVFVFAG